MKWVTQPDKEGYWWFKGNRISRAKKYVVLVDGPVQVRFDKVYPEPTVFYPGLGTVYVIGQHDGFWCYLDDMFQEVQIG